LDVAAVYDRRKRRSQSAATIWSLKHLPTGGGYGMLTAVIKGANGQ